MGARNAAGRITEALNKAKGRGQALVVSEVLTALMDVWGGSECFAKAFHMEFVEAKAGGLVRARMLDSILRLFQVHTANLKGKDVNLEGLSDDDLRAAVEDLLGGQHGQGAAAATP